MKNDYLDEGRVQPKVGCNQLTLSILDPSIYIERRPRLCILNISISCEIPRTDRFIIQFIQVIHHLSMAIPYTGPANYLPEQNSRDLLLFAFTREPRALFQPLPAFCPQVLLGLAREF